MIEFLEKAFGATVVHRMDYPNGDFWQADLQLGDSHVMIGGASEEWPEQPSQIYFYVEDADATYKRALDAGDWSSHWARSCSIFS